MNAPDLTFRSASAPYATIGSFTYIQSKLGSGPLPVFAGEVSNTVLFRIYNNFAMNSSIANALNVMITTYDGATPLSHVANKLPVSQSWLHVVETGFGENSVAIPDRYTQYLGIDTAVGGDNNKYEPQKGSDGIYGISRIRAYNNNNGLGFIEIESYIGVPVGAVGNLYSFVISVLYEWTS